MSQRTSVPLKLTLPPRPNLHSHSARYYPPLTPTSSKASLPFSPLLTPTPSKRPRASEIPLWILTFFELLSYYAVYKWLAGFGRSPPLVIFTFSTLLASSAFLVVVHRAWKGRSVLSLQWGLLAGSGGILALSFLLRFQGLISCGPLESISADFAGSLAGKVLLEFRNKSSDKSRKARGLLVLLFALFVLSQGWARASCSPIAFDIGYRTRSRPNYEQKDCGKLFVIVAPTLAGILSAFQKSMAGRSPLRSIGRKRVHILSHAVAAFILFPFAVLQLAVMAGQTWWGFDRSVIWPWFSTVTFGMIIAYYSDSYSEEKLLTPPYSVKTFSIITCCVVILELLYGLDVSLIGFLFSLCLLGFGVRELNMAPGDLFCGAIGDSDSSSFGFSSWVKSPLQHIMFDKKSRKIAIFLLINSGFMVVEFCFGFVSNSLGLISDACHMLFDCAALAIGLYASYISRLPANAKFNYGYGRFEVVSGYANAVLLVLAASLIVLESFERILEPPEVSTESLLLVSLGGLLVNLVGLAFFHDEHHLAHGGGGCSHSHTLHPAEKLSDKDTISSSSVAANYGTRDCSHSHSHHHSDKLSDENKHSSSSVVAGETAHFDCQNGHKSNFLLLNHNGRSGDESLNTLLNKTLDEDVNSCSLSYHHTQVMSCEHSSKEGADDAFSVKPVANGHIDPPILRQHLKEDHDGHMHDCSCVPLESTVSHHHKHLHEHSREHVTGNLVLQADPCDGAGIVSSSGPGLDSTQHCSIQNCSHGSNCKQRLEERGLTFGKSQPNCSHSHLGQHDRKTHEGKLSDDHSCSHHHSIDKHSQSDHLEHHNPGHHHHHHHHHHHQMDHNMQGIFLHVLADTLGSVGVVISTLLIKYKGWLVMDPACSIFISGLIITSVVPLLRNSAEILLQRVPRFNQQSLREAVTEVKNIPGVQSCQRVHVWSFTNKEVVGSLQLQASAGSDKMAVRRAATRLLHGIGIVDLTLQVEDV